MCAGTFTFMNEICMGGPRSGHLLRHGLLSSHKKSQMTNEKITETNFSYGPMATGT